MEQMISSGRSVASKTHVTGFLTIHSAPAALRPHIEWGLQSILGTWVALEWKPQPKATGTFRTTLEFRDRAGSAAKVATALKAWHYLRFDFDLVNMCWLGFQCNDLVVDPSGL